MTGPCNREGLTTTTADPPRGILLTLRKDGDGYHVKDMVGLRYGWDETVEGAVKMWAGCVMDVVEELDAGGPLLVEQNRYRAALEMEA